MNKILTILLALACICACSAPNEFVITVIGTNDVHGELLPRDGEGGLVSFSAYVEAVRAARGEDGGAVILLDAGDMWQGTLESNTSEGATMIEAYNALGYTAIAVGNHEFDFGPAGPLAIPKSPEDDPRGALKQRAAEANFPFLAANLIDTETDKPVQWPNVQPSVMLDVQGVQIGIVGVMTINALARAIASNTVGLRIAPLADAVEKEAALLRDAGATIVLVSAHAGGGCGEWTDPTDTTSCYGESEVFTLANSLPTGLVDYILAGHTHNGIAHIVNGIAISEGFSRATNFSRLDLLIDRETGLPISRTMHPPKSTTLDFEYEEQPLAPTAAILAIAEKARLLAADMKMERIGIHLSTPFTLTENPESALGNLYTDALLAAVDANISMHRTNTMIRADLPAGDLTMGSVYEMSPFDNQITVITLTGSELRQVVATQAHHGRFRVGFSGMRVTVDCSNKNKSVVMQLTDGRVVADADAVTIAVADYLALGGDDVFAAVMPEGGYPRQLNAPFARDSIVDFLQSKGDSISVSDFSSASAPKWTLPETLDPECRLPN